METSSVRVKRKKHQLSVSEMTDIVHRVVIGLLSHQDVANDFSIKVSLVGSLVRQAKMNRSFLAELKSREIAKQEAFDAVSHRASQIIDGGGNIWKAGAIAGMVKDLDGIDVKT